MSSDVWNYRKVFTHLNFRLKENKFYEITSNYIYWLLLFVSLLFVFYRLILHFCTSVFGILKHLCWCNTLKLLSFKQKELFSVSGLSVSIYPSLITSTKQWNSAFIQSAEHEIKWLCVCTRAPRLCTYIFWILWYVILMFAVCFMYIGAELAVMQESRG